MHRKSRLAMAVAIASTGSMESVAQGNAPGESIEEVVVTGSRIKRQDYIANSPISTVTAEQMNITSGTTIDKYLNTLPQINPSSGSTSNNPGNNGQSNVNLRGLGANRNLVLIDGRRAMPSASDMTVDLNTIPSVLIDSIEIVTGGAGAVYGADAVAGAVNIKLKDDFEGFDFRYSYSDSEKEEDARDYTVSAVWGGNFSDDKGNAVIALDHSNREGMYKNQREFAANATSTTPFLPEGSLGGSSGNQIPQSAVNALFARPDYGSNPAGSTNSTLLGFNTDGSLFSRGVFNTPQDVLNWRYPLDGNINYNVWPDLYSYNFDYVNILTLPLERDSVMGKLNYEFDNGVEAWAQFGYTQYSSTTALAPTPWPTISTQSPTGTNPGRATSALVEAGRSVSGAVPVPVTNPFIPADLAFLLAQRTGNNASLVSSGATEPFLMSSRLLDGGLRNSDFENKVVSFSAGVSGDFPELPFGKNWSWDIYAMEGYTYIDEKQYGNIDTNKALGLLAAADGGKSTCDGGLNIFGRSLISPACVSYLQVPPNEVSTDFRQRIAQAFIEGEVVELPAGPLALVLGYEARLFDYELDPGSSTGPISGLNVQTASNGDNNFYDWFTEIGVPVVRDQPWVKALDLTFGFRVSTYQFDDKEHEVQGDVTSDNTWKAELNWQIDDTWRTRASYQRAVRAPNFSELFDGGGDNPQYFDPCSIDTAARNGPDAAALAQLCLDTGLAPATINTFVQTPGRQLSLTVVGNTDLKSEEADTYTLGVVFTSPWSGIWENLQFTLDWYDIEIKDPIDDPSVNIFVADCYNYYGNNPNYDPNHYTCLGVNRPTGDDIRGYSPPADTFFPGQPEYYYPSINGGVLETSGIDFTAAYGVDLPVGHLDISTIWSWVDEFIQSDAPGMPEIDYAGTVSYFGEGLGTSYPEWKGTTTFTYSINDFSFDLRVNYIDDMENRQRLQFPGETAQTGVDAIWYFDIAGAYTWRDSFTFRVGLENATDEDPETYAPNVQSGTEPSLYDVIGRRIYGQFEMRF